MGSFVQAVRRTPLYLRLLEALMLAQAIVSLALWIITGAWLDLSLAGMWLAGGGLVLTIIIREWGTANERREPAILRTDANLRAEQLFLALLTPKQREQWLNDRKLTLIGSDGEHYTLRLGYAYNVFSGGRRYCATLLPERCLPFVAFPAYDCLLAQKLMIEVDAPRFKQIANQLS